MVQDLFLPTTRAVPHSQFFTFCLLLPAYELHDYLSVSFLNRSSLFLLRLGLAALRFGSRLPRQLLSVDQAALKPPSNVN